MVESITTYNTEIEFYKPSPSLPMVKETKIKPQNDTIRSCDDEDSEENLKKLKNQSHGEGVAPLPLQVTLGNKPILEKPLAEISPLQKKVFDEKIFRGDEADVKLDGETFKAYEKLRESHSENCRSDQDRIRQKLYYRKKVQEDLNELHQFAESRGKKSKVLGWIGKVAGISSIFLSVGAGVITFVTGGLGAFLGALPAIAKGIEGATTLSTGIMKVKSKNDTAMMSELREKSDLARTQVSMHLNEAQNGNKLFHLLWRECIQLNKKIRSAMDSIKVS